HPTRPASGNFRINEIFRDFQCRCEGLAGLPCEHADLEAAFIVQPAALVWVKDGAHASPRYMAFMRSRASSGVRPADWAAAVLAASSTFLSASLRASSCRFSS